MAEHRIIILSALLVCIISAGSISGCSHKQEKADRKPVSAASEQAAPVDDAAKQAFRKKIDALDIPVYKNATFVDIKRKSKDSPLLYAEFVAPETRKKTYDEVKSYYAAALKKALGSKGWTMNPSAENVILYRKGFEMFFVELSRVSAQPEGKKIRIVMQYGA